MLYQSGDRVKTKVLQDGDATDIWVSATVIGVNGDSESYNLAVDKQWHDRFAPEALRVPPELVERLEDKEQKSLISQIIFPNARMAEEPKQPTQAPDVDMVQSNLKYAIGEKVQTRIVYGRKDSQAKWIEAEIVLYNQEDDSWNLTVSKPKQHKVMKNAVHVPDIHVRKMPNTPEPPSELQMMPITELDQSDIDAVIAKGHGPRLAKLALQMSSGDLSFASNLLEAGRQPARESEIQRGGVLHVHITNVESAKPLSCVYMKLDGNVKVTDALKKQTTKADFDCIMTWSDYSPCPNLEIELWQHNRFMSNKCVGRKRVEDFGDIITRSVDHATKLKVDMLDKGKVSGHVEIQVLIQKTGLKRVEI